MARFGQALKPSKPPQQLSSQPSAATFTGVPLTLPWYLPIGLRNCHVARFRQALNKTFKTSAAAFEGLRTSQPSAAAFGHGTSLSPTSCFYWASKLVRGTFWAGLKTLKISAAAFEGLRTSQPSAAAFGHGTSLGPTSCFYWLRNCYLARFGQALKPSKPPQQLSKASEPHNPPQQLSQASHLLCHGTSLGATSCFYWALKLPRGTFSAGLKAFTTSAAAFEGLRTSQPSAAAFTGVPLALPWYLPRRHKLFLLGFETATWHVFGRP